MTLLFFIAVPFILALAAPLLLRRSPCSVQGALMATALAALFVGFCLHIPAVSAGETQTLSVAWMPQIGLTLSFTLDGLALLFALVITGVGTAVMLYAGYYFERPGETARFFGLLTAFTGSMLALVTAGNVLTLFIAWEATSIISFLLIGFKGKDSVARQSASQALMITGGGGLALLVGLILLGTAAGSFELSDILANGDILRDHPWTGAVIVLIALGAFTKSAQFPFHFWLPNAMSAPTPASAFLHSATMVKAGIYLLARLEPALGTSELWTTALTGFGLLTLGFGAVVALRQTDLKGMLAYSTISQLGALVALIGLPESAGIKAAMVGILAHALYKGALFLVVGAVDHATGTRNIYELGGLRRLMPGFAAVTAVVGLSMAGVPPLFGFVGKELLLEAKVEQPIALVVVVVSAALTVTLAMRLYWDVFMGRRPIPLPQQKHGEHDAHHPLGDDAHDFSHVHELPRGMVAGPAALAALSVVAGIGISPLITPIVEPAVGKPITLYLLPPGGINLPFLLSMIALALGTGLFVIRRLWLAPKLPTLVTGPQVYQAIVGGVFQFGDLLLRSQGGKIRLYLAVILLSVIGFLALPLVLTDWNAIALTVTFSGAAEVLEAALLVLALVATLASILLERHLLAALSLGVAGYAIGGIFLLEPAPDVALVQFLVETLATVLIIVILARTSPEERQRAMQRLWGQSRAGLARDVVIAASMGAVVSLFALAAVNTRAERPTIAEWHLANALPQVGAPDVVAAIITDFRGMDTLIEITVFSAAGLGVLTLLARPTAGRVRSWRRKPQSAMSSVSPASKDESDDNSMPYRSDLVNPITSLAAQLALPFSFLIAVAHIFYAGVAPGDGFTAGVILGLGIALWFIVFGYEETRRRLRWMRPAPLIGIGLVLALANAGLPLLADRSFFSFTPLQGVSLADIKLASTTVFEIGICLSVFGGISTIMEAISHPKECEPL